MRALLVIVLPVAGLLAAGLRIRIYSRRRIVAELAFAGRGLYFSRTPDGDWWKLRLRRRRCAPTGGTWPADDPPGAGTREPRRPPGPRPLAAAARPDLD